jgi:hypothetical protein
MDHWDGKSNNPEPTKTNVFSSTSPNVTRGMMEGQSLMDEVNGYRDFLLAAFSDGYSNVRTYLDILRLSTNESYC